MPIADAFLDRPLNAHIWRPARDTVLDALRTWRATPLSAVWWWLVIDHGSGRFTALRFDTLRQLLLRPDLGVTMLTPLGNLPPAQHNPADWTQPVPGVIEPRTVDMDEISPSRARQIQANSPANLLVVLRDGFFRGVLAGSERTFAFTDDLLLDMLEHYEQQAAESPDTPATQNSSPEQPPT